MSKQLSITSFTVQKQSEFLQPMLPEIRETMDTYTKTVIGIGNAAVGRVPPDNHGRKRGAYNIVSPSKRAKIGRFAAEKGNTNASRHFNVPESTARYYKKLYFAKLNEVKDPNDVTNLEHASRGRPLKLGKMDKIVQDYLKKLRLAGGVINKTIVISVGKGIVAHQVPLLLSTNGGGIELGRKWAESILRRMNFVRRKGTKAARHLPKDFEEVKLSFMNRLKTTTAGVEPELIINFDQTVVKLVPTSEWTLSEQGQKQVAIAAVNDKRENTVLIGITLEGKVLPPQIIYAGKTKKCHPDVLFPRDWNITHSSNHWSNLETMLEYADKVIIPYVSRIRRTHGLPTTHPAVALFDHFAAHRTEQFLTKLREAHIKVVFIPAGCTGELQPLDVAFNDEFKKRMKAKFTEYYSLEIKKGLDSGQLIEDIHVDLSTSKMKAINGKWIVATIGEMMVDKERVRSAWSRAGITQEIEGGLGQLPDSRPGLFDVFKN